MISALLKTTVQQAIAYLQELNHRSVSPTQDAIDRLTPLNQPLPDHPTAPEQVLELLDAIGSPATMANFTALAAARNRVLMQAGWNIEADGLLGAPEIQVVVSQEVHPSLLKALGLLGLGHDRVIKVPVDDQGRMIAEKLPDLHDRSIVCVQAGNVNTESFDRIREICDRAEASGAWVHVDGAFGLWAAVVPRLAHLTAGREPAGAAVRSGREKPPCESASLPEQLPR